MLSPEVRNMDSVRRYLEDLAPGISDRMRFMRRRVFVAGLLVITLGLFGYFFTTLRAPSASAHEESFVIESGEGAVEISNHLEERGIIRDANAFRILAFLTFRAHRLQAGNYLLPVNTSAFNILHALVEGSVREIEVRIPEGASMYQIDSILSLAGVIRTGALIDYVLKSPEPIEGRLFPDSYRFFPGTPPEKVVEKMKGVFDAKALSLLQKDPANLERNLVLASILEKEVPHISDRKIVAGIVLKRKEEGMALQVDASVCYAKQIKNKAFGDCLPITALDLKIDSPYNTYLHSGWPPGPIGNPGLEAIQAALSPEKSPYWFYLSDPKTQNTIFSKTLDEHAKNRVKYL